jgi:hypothetical protein
MITNTRVKYVVVDRPRDLAYFVSPEKVTVVHGSQVVGAVKFGQQQRSQRTGDADVSQTNGDLYLGIIGQGAAPSFVTVLNGTSIVGLVPGVDGRRIVANQDTGVAYAEDLSGHVTVLDGTNVAGHLTLTAALNSWDPVTRTVIADGTLQTALARGATPTLVVIRGTKVVQRLDYPSTIDLTNDPAAHRMYLIVGRTKAKTGARIAELRSQPVN